MAPEFPPSLVIIDLSRDQGELRYKSEYAERGEGSIRLRVRWLDEKPAEGFLSVGGGVAHVLETNDLSVGMRGEGIVERSVHEDGYTWQESVNPEDPWRMLVIVFPQGEVAVDLLPHPERAKSFEGRLAAFWVLRGDEFGRTRIQWRLETTEGDILSAYYKSRKRLQEPRHDRETEGSVPPPASAATDSQPLLFLSYSHKDENEKVAFMRHLKVLEVAARKVEIWSDDDIHMGEDWNKEIEEALHVSAAAVLIITPDFLGSGYINGKEVPELLRRKCGKGLHVFPVIAKHCAFRTVPWLAEMQVRPKNGVPIWSPETTDPEKVLSEIVEEIAGLL